MRAGKEGRKFRVIIVIPAIPGFAGDLRDNAALGTRAIMDYQYKSICRGEHSIFGQIEKEGIDPRGRFFFSFFFFSPVSVACLTSSFRTRLRVRPARL